MKRSKKIPNRSYTYKHILTKPGLEILLINHKGLDTDKQTALLMEDKGSGPKSLTFGNGLTIPVHGDHSQTTTKCNKNLNNKRKR